MITIGAIIAFIGFTGALLADADKTLKWFIKLTFTGCLTILVGLFF